MFAEGFVETSSFPVRRKCNLIEPLVDGVEYFNRIEQDINGSHALLIALSFCSADFRMPSGRMGSSWLDFLDFASRDGRCVYVLAWNDTGKNPLFSGGTFGEDWASSLKKRGLSGRVKVRWTVSAPDDHHCHHEKSFVLLSSQHVVKCAYTGGIITSPGSVSKCGHEGERTMHDVGMRVEGKVATDIARAFAERWNVAIGKREPHDSEDFQDMVDGVDCNGVDGQVCRSLREGLLPGKQASGESSIVDCWKKCIQMAQKTIYIEQQHLVHRELTQALRACMARGVKVMYVRPGLVEGCRMSTTKEDAVKVRNMWGGRTRAEYEHVLIEEMELWEQYSSNQTLSLCGIAFRDGRIIHVHSKMMIVDDEWSIIGSANLVDLSMTPGPELHTEICVVWHCAQTSLQLRKRLMLEHFGTYDWDDASRVARCNSEMMLKGKPNQMSCNAFAMSPRAWGMATLPLAVRMYENARP